MTRLRRDEGFTLVELMVVMVILGVLAAIAIPTFLTQKEKGYRATATSDARALRTAEVAWLTEADGYTDDVDDLRTSGLNLSTGVEEPVIQVTGSGYVACLKHASLSKWLVVDSDSTELTWADENVCA